MPLVTLDAVYARLGLRPPVGIKIDTEGYELEVLRDAREVLPETAWVMLRSRSPSASTTATAPRPA